MELWPPVYEIARSVYEIARFGVRDGPPAVSGGGVRNGPTMNRKARRAEAPARKARRTEIATPVKHYDAQVDELIPEKLAHLESLPKVVDEDFVAVGESRTDDPSSANSRRNAGEEERFAVARMKRNEEAEANDFDQRAEKLSRLARERVEEEQTHATKAALRAPAQKPPEADNNADSPT